MLNLKRLLDNPQYKSILEILNIIVQLSKKEKKETYVVGGFVRDLIMQRQLNDIDIMVVGDGINFAKIIAQELKIKKVVLFEKFGTALIPGKKVQIEVASARKEEYLFNSRKPKKVVYTDLNGDLVRRDFTINAMAMHLSVKNFGKINDPYNGKNDIEKKRLRTPLDPDETFSEDPLRMMRAAYFSSKLGFSIDKECLESIKKQSHRISIVSWERIRDEFIKIYKQINHRLV